MARQSLRKAFGEPPGSLRARAASVVLTPPCTVRQILDAFNADIVYTERLVTSGGVTLGGEFKLVLHRDGQWDFSGHFHASGLPSYTASLLVTVGFGVASIGGVPKGAFQVAFNAHGTAHGSSEPGSDSYNWSQQGTSTLIQANWARVRMGAFGRRLEYDADWFGPVGDLVAFIGEIVLMNGAFGSAGVAIALLGEVAAQADLDELMLPGLVGVGLAAGAVYFISPGLMIPAFIAGAAATPALIQQSSLSQAERNFADQVFGGTIPYDRIVKTSMTNHLGNAFTFPLPSNPILLNLGEGFNNPTTYTGSGSEVSGPAAPGQVFIHELAHAWQIAHDSFTPWFYCRATATAVAGVWDDTLYAYGPAETLWSDMGVEQQAEVVSEWFGGWGAQAMFGPKRDDSAPMAPDFFPPNPYFRYIRDHIWAEVT